MTEWASQPPRANERLLLNELNHRINNEFASAIAAVSLAAARSGSIDVKTALRATAERLNHYAAVHQALQMPDPGLVVNAAAYLRKLCLAISRSKLADMEIQLVLAASPVRLESQRCWRLGLIVHELITNAARHAFGYGAGKIRVELAHAGGFAECTVLDNGSAAERLRPGRGLTIIRELVEVLDGRFEQTFGSCGSTSRLIFRAPESLSAKTCRHGQAKPNAG